MKPERNIAVSWPELVAGGAILLAIGATGMYAVARRAPGAPTPASEQQVTPPPQSPPPSPATTFKARHADIVVPMTADMIARAGIVVEPVTAGAAAGVRRLPGVVEANAYKSVTVTSLVGGRLDRVTAELGQRVQRGQPLAKVFTPELSEAESRYLAARTALDAHERELQRTERLVQIGAASRQELEMLHAEHAARLSDVDAARSRLGLLGLSQDAVEKLSPGGSLDAVATVTSPLTGTVIDRRANAGANVSTSDPLFTIADLSTVWALADAYEQDFASLRAGAHATVRVNGREDLRRDGVVSYIDPRVDPQTRTAKLRVELRNDGGELRPGMFAEVEVQTTAAGEYPQVPTAAIQRVGDRTVVYLARPGQSEEFVEREVRIAASAGDRVAVVEGLSVGDTVVVQGSFAVRAERERLGLVPEASASPSASMSIRITERGFEPASLSLPSGRKATLTFTRTTDQTCATSVVFPSLNITRELPLNQPVAIDVTMPASGSLAFQCGMNMLKGSITAQ